MNCKQAKPIKLTEIMDKLGYKPVKTFRNGEELCYLSPFRNEATGSFFVNTLKNQFYDFGSGEGAGGSLEFAIQYLNSNGKSSSISDALQFLSSLGFGKDQSTKPLFPFEKRNTIPRKNLVSDEGVKDLQFIRAFPIEHPSIFQYLGSRGISEPLVKKYVEQVQYRNIKKNKVFFAFGMKNRAGGYEIRSASDTPVFKSALIARSTTYIEGNHKAKENVLVFEGMVDFLSYLELYQINEPFQDCIIMHSLSSYNETLEFIKEQGYKTINLYLDNDTAGRKHNQRFIDDCPKMKIIDNAGLYSGFNDLNDSLSVRDSQLSLKGISISCFSIEKF